MSNFWRKAHRDAVLFNWQYLKNMGWSEEERKVLEEARMKEDE